MSKTKVTVAKPGSANSHVPRSGRIAIACVELRRHPPRDDVQKAEAEIERDPAEPGRDREQHSRQRRIDELEIGAVVDGIEARTMQHLLAGPVPERIVLGLAAAPDFRDQHEGGQHDAAEQEQHFERRSKRRPSQRIGIRRIEVTRQRTGRSSSPQHSAERATHQRAADRAAQRSADRFADIGDDSTDDLVGDRARELRAMSWPVDSRPRMHVGAEDRRGDAAELPEQCRRRRPAFRRRRFRDTLLQDLVGEFASIAVSYLPLTGLASMIALRSSGVTVRSAPRRPRS